MVERSFQHELPCNPSGVVRWRRRIGEVGCEWLLEHSTKSAQSSGALKRQSLSIVVVDTAVQPKAVAHPSDSLLLDQAREQLVANAQDAGIQLRRSCARVGNAVKAKAGRYAHAKQWQRVRREIKRLRTWLGRVIRDVQLKVEQVGGVLETWLESALRLHAQ